MLLSHSGETARFSVSVVVVNHNSGPFLDQCLNSILHQASQVVLVDNASESETFERSVAKFRSNEGLTIIRNPRNEGFAAACNQGALHATGRNLLFFNPDCIAPPRLLEGLSRAIEIDSRIGAVGCFLMNPDGTEQGGGRRAAPTVSRSFIRAFGFRWLCRFFNPRAEDYHLESNALPSGPIAVHAVSGACILVRRNAFEEIGGFDPGYFLHCEDLDICLRLRQNGWDVYFVPQLRVQHEKGVCGRNQTVFVEWHKHLGMKRYYHKHLRTGDSWAMAALVQLGIWIHFFWKALFYAVRTALRLLYTNAMP